MRRKEVVEFRTPQHPSLGKNYWGGDSPLLARNIPKESLDQKYMKLTTVRTCDEVFPVFEDDDELDWVTEINTGMKERVVATRKRIVAMRGLKMPKFVFWRNENKVDKLDLGCKKNRWFPRLDPRNRWPQGWC